MAARLISVTVLTISTLGVVLAASAGIAPLAGAETTTATETTAAAWGGGGNLPCTVHFEFVGGHTLRIKVNPSDSLVFLQPPGFEFEIVDSDDHLVAAGVEPDGIGVSPIDVNIAGWDPGKYTIHGFSSGTCHATFHLIAELDPTVTVSGDCGSAEVPLGTTVTLQGSFDDPAGLVDTTMWRLPNGVDIEGTEHEYTFTEAGEHNFAFIAVVFYDDKPTNEFALCSVMVVASSTPSPTGTPAPSTPTPNPTTPPSTPAPTPTSVPATPDPSPQPTTGPNTPAPSPEPSPEPIPTPTLPSTSPTDPDPTPEPTAPEPTPAPTQGPLTANDVDPGDFEPNSDGEPDVRILPGTLEASWPAPMFVEEPSRIQVDVIASDWRPEATRFGDDVAIVSVDDGRQKHLIAIYGAEGEIDLRLEFVDPDRLELLPEGSADTPDPVRTIDFQPKIRKTVSWPVRPLKSGPAEFTIRVERVEQAIPQDAATDAELAALRVEDLNLALTLEVDVRDRTEWLGFSWWHALPLLLLPWLPVADLGWSSRRNRRNPGHVAPVAAGAVAAPSQGDVALALSGGGLRATAFSLGVSMYLADAGAWPQVRQVASVSGGSLTNAFVARRSTGLGRAPATADELAPLADSVAERGLPLERSFGLFAAALVAGAAWIVGLLWWAAPDLVSSLPWMLLGVVVFGLTGWLIYVWAGIRPSVRRWVPNFVGIPTDLRLASLGSGSNRIIDHIFTASSTRSDQVHLAPQQMIIAPPEVPDALADAAAVADRELVIGVPDKITVAQAVQASAAFPGLPRVMLDARDAGFASRSGKLALRDGGTSDNLGHIGETLFEEIDPTLAGFLTAHGAIQRWIVVDSSAHRMERGKRPGWVVALLNSLNLGVAADLAEMAGTAQSEQTADSAARIRSHFATTGTGVYVGLRDSPYDICRDALVATGLDPISVDDAIGHLLRTGEMPAEIALTDEQAAASAALERVVAATRPTAAAPYWEAQRVTNAGINTTLSSLGAEHTGDLVHHGYTLAAVQCHIRFGWALPAPEALRPDRFANPG